MQWSKTGLVSAALYSISAVFLFGKAMTCIGIACGLVALPVFLPAGYIYWFPFSGKLGNYVPDPLSGWAFVIPTAITNMVFYYFLGHAVAAAFAKMFNRYVR